MKTSMYTSTTHIIACLFHGFPCTKGFNQIAVSHLAPSFISLGSHEQAPSMGHVSPLTHARHRILWSLGETTSRVLGVP